MTGMGKRQRSRERATVSVISGAAGDRGRQAPSRYVGSSSATGKDHLTDPARAQRRVASTDPLDDLTLGDVYRRHLARPIGPYEGLANHLTIAATLLRDNIEDHQALGRLQVAMAIRQELDGLEEQLVAEARSAGATWQQVADSLGVARQTAWGKYQPRAEAWS